MCVISSNVDHRPHVQCRRASASSYGVYLVIGYQPYNIGIFTPPPPPTYCRLRLLSKLGLKAREVRSNVNAFRAAHPPVAAGCRKSSTGQLPQKPTATWEQVATQRSAGPAGQRDGRPAATAGRGLPSLTGDRMFGGSSSRARPAVEAASGGGPMQAPSFTGGGASAKSSHKGREAEASGADRRETSGTCNAALDFGIKSVRKNCGQGREDMLQRVLPLDPFRVKRIKLTSNTK